MKKEFTISLDIYNEENISQSIVDFSEVADMWFSQGVLTIQGESEDEIQEVFHEFMNYVLSI